MTGGVFALVLFAAAFHAGWNAIVKAAGDKMLTAVLVAGAAALIAGAALPFLPMPAPASWPFMGMSVVLQCVYYLLVARAYTVADMSQTYPIMRGTAPLIVAAVGTVVMGEHLAPAAWAGIALICGGILTIAAEARADRRGLAVALLNALVIAAYTLTDGMGARASDAAVAYSFWVFALTGVPLVLWAVLARRADFGAHLRANLWPGVAGGIGTLVSYTIALWAMTQAPVAVIAALRETSILFGIAIAALILRERVGPARIAAAALIAAGAVALRLG